MPPYPQPSKYHHHMSKAKKEKVKSQKNFYYFFFGLFFIGILFAFTKSANLKSGSSSSNTNNQNPASNTKFELFNEQGSSNLTTSQNTIKIRILDGASTPINMNIAKDMLLRAGFEIEKSDSANNTYGQSIVYYKNGQVNQAQKAADTLKPTFIAQLQESASLDNNYDLLIIIGTK